MKKKRLRKVKSPKLLFAVWLLGGLLLAGGVAGATTFISQGFFTSSDIAPGSLVSLQNNSTDSVEPATSDNVDNLFGVVLGGSQPSVALSSDQSKQVQVSTNGVEEVLVSDINGAIASGDSITASPISGVGMKASTNIKVIGVAQGKFPNSTAKKQTYKDKSGQTQTVMLGETPVLVNVSEYYVQPNKTLIPPAVQNIANALAGKKVDSLPILVSIGIFIVAMVVVVSIIYSMIRSSIISVGRNPMSQAAIYRNVIQLSALVVVILAVTVMAIYMVLRKF